jgi:hypothetical protein
MIRFRAVGSYVDLCSLPSPHRIPCSVAGMAFNFSKIELAHPAAQPNRPKPPQTQPAPAVSGRIETRRHSFAQSQSTLAS